MNEINLTKKEMLELIQYHKECREKKNAYRINVIILLAKKYSHSEIADALLIDEKSVQRYKKIFLEAGVDGLLVDNYKGSQKYLDENQVVNLQKHLEENTYLRSIDIVQYIKKEFKITYTPEGLVPLLHKLGFEYKKTKHIPGKADIEKQKQFIKKYRKIRKKLKEMEAIYFIDAVHPTFNSMLAYGWIKKGTEKYIKSNTGRERININGAYNPINNEIIAYDFKTINKESTLTLLKMIRSKNEHKNTVYVFMDRARYNYSLKVREYAKKNKIKIEYLPTYSPNLNLIERLWHFMKKETMYNKYYENFEYFHSAIFKFLKRKDRLFKDQLKSLITENFHIFNST
jgi:transposase